MTTKANKAAAAAENESTEAQNTVVEKDTVTVVVIGACLVRINKVSHTFGDEFELTNDQLSTQGIKHLFVSKILEAKDNSALTKEIIASATSKRKKDPNAGKTLEQLEDGGTFK